MEKSESKASTEMRNADANPPSSRWENFSLFLSLFTSSGTLICCALPALLVSLGAGASLAGIVGRFPALVTLSENKGVIFSLAGLLLAGAGYLQWRAKDLPCPIDPKIRDACARARKVSLVIYFLSLGLYAIGVLFAYALPRL